MSIRNLLAPWAISIVLGVAPALEGFRVLDRTKVYHGFADAFAAPAVVEASRVMDVLPATKKIREEKVPKDSARWYVLINEANQQFQRVLRTVAKDGGHDLVAEVGSVTGSKPIPNVTDVAIAVAARG